MFTFGPNDTEQYHMNLLITALNMYEYELFKNQTYASKSHNSL
jgi:hypothetical protein